MISIYDGEVLLGRIIRLSEINHEGVNFISPETEELQIAVMNHPMDREIPRHHHPRQDRNIKSTTEILVVTEGVLHVSFFDLQGNLKWSGDVKPISIVALLSGGHSFRSITDSTFVEIKQGPYYPTRDKEHY
jgi:hypothetical protein